MYQKLIAWEVSNNKYNLKANTVVPNDITKLLYEQNIIEEPYFGLNHRYLKEYLDEDLYQALRYTEQDSKTDEKKYVSGVNC